MVWNLPTEWIRGRAWMRAFFLRGQTWTPIEADTRGFTVNCVSVSAVDLVSSVVSLVVDLVLSVVSLVVDLVSCAVAVDLVSSVLSLVVDIVSSVAVDLALSVVDLIQSSVLVRLSSSLTGDRLLEVSAEVGTHSRLDISSCTIYKGTIYYCNSVLSVFLE